MIRCVRAAQAAVVGEFTGGAGTPREAQKDLQASRIGQPAEQLCVDNQFDAVMDSLFPHRHDYFIDH